MEYYLDFINDYRFEYENSGCLLEFQEWIALEHFFGQRLSIGAYDALSSYYNEDETVDGNILDLGTKDPAIRAFRAGDSAMYSDRNGNIRKCRIVGLIQSNEEDMAAIGPIFVIRDENGRKTCVSYKKFLENTSAVTG